MSPSANILHVPGENVAEERQITGVPRRKSTGTLFNKENKTGSDESACLELCDESGAPIGLYRLGNSIGKGQFGTVYRALNVKTGQMVAIKQIKLSADYNDLEDVMQQEARLLQSLAHPNIVRYEGFIQDAECINIVLEFVENGSLANTLKAFGSFPESLVASYSLRILQGLAYLHDQRVAHCDLKAANILTTKAGDVKLSDFGVSLNLHLKEAATGTVAGTPNWMAPEVIELKGATTKSDIWSLGCTIIELYTGKPPYADLIPMTTLFRIVEDDCPPLPISLPTEMRNFLELCFRKNPDDRPTALELLTHPWIMQNAANLPETDQSSLSDMGSVPEESCFFATQRNSILVHKLQERQGKGEERMTEREHCFVKGSFAKGNLRRING
ncbi:kinase-like domain-containing protein [Syncephalastrum racemosum]|uniref:non-specific serine/threonine protein kinase n=1 Tax=Syncephalastrum racemosum TaxID=13706 RepID=A0A1X2HHP6_SYNRA|nr:kinase-like domain-containing protein [Syncephalastrum racemosum]